LGSIPDNLRTDGNRKMLQKNSMGEGLNDDWIAEVARDFPIESLSEELQVVAEIAGCEACLRLCARLGGMTVYLPKIERVVRDRRNKMILHEFDGANYRKLANKYRVSETQIRKIISDLTRGGEAGE